MSIPNILDLGGGRRVRSPMEICLTESLGVVAAHRVTAPL